MNGMINEKFKKMTFITECGKRLYGEVAVSD